MEIRRLPLSVVKQNTGQIDGLPCNPRQWTQTDIDRIAKSLKETPELFDARPLIVLPHGDEYVILGGNLRYEGAKKNRMKEVPVHILPEGLSIDKLKEIVIKDNGSFGDWDMDMLANEWDDLPLKEWGVDIAWDAVHLEEAGVSSAERKEVEEDDFDEAQDKVETRCKRGDIWLLGDHRLMCGDSTNADDVKMLMNGEKADMVFTDPPYNVAIGDKNAALNAFTGSKSIERNLEGDTFKTDEECGQKLWKPAFTNMLNASKDKCSIYVTMPQGGTHMMMMMMMHEAGWQVKHELIWVKSSPTFSMGRLDYDYQHEPICFGWKKSHKKIGKGKFTKSIWEIEKPKKCDLHPTMKPIELVVNALENSSEEGDVILDLFGGSGTTLIATEQVQRKARLMELDTHYCDVIIARWEKFTGKQAVKI